VIPMTVKWPVGNRNLRNIWKSPNCRKGAQVKVKFIIWVVILTIRLPYRRGSAPYTQRTRDCIESKNKKKRESCPCA
jgi:hypothetical protein